MEYSDNINNKINDKKTGGIIIGPTNGIKTIISILVVSLLIVVVVVPIVASQFMATEEIENTGAPFAAPDGAAHNIQASTSALSVDNESYDITQLIKQATDSIILAGSNGFITYVLEGGRGAVSGQSCIVVGETRAVVSTLEVAINGDVATVTSGANTYTINDVMYYISNNGDYVMTTSPTVKDDTLVLFGTRVDQDRLPSSSYRFAVECGGTIEELAEYVLSYSGFEDNLTYSNATVDKTPLEHETYTLNSIDLLFTYSTNSEYTFTFTAFIVPKTIQIEVESDSPVASIAAILPVLILVAVAVGVISLMYSNSRT